MKRHFLIGAAIALFLSLSLSIAQENGSAAIIAQQGNGSVPVIAGAMMGASYFPSTMTIAQTKGVFIEIDIPRYFPSSLKYPKILYSGRDIRITSPDKVDTFSASLASENTGKTIDLPEKKRRGNSSVVVTIPYNTTTGTYSLTAIINGEKNVFAMDIQGPYIPARKAEARITAADTPIVNKKQVCSNCYWEDVFAGDPTNSKNLVLVGIYGRIHRSADGGHTWNNGILPDYNGAGFSLQSFGDPKIVALNNTRFLIETLSLYNWGEPFGGLLYNGSFSGSGFVTTIFDANNGSIDKPVFAVVNNSIVYAANQDVGYGLHISQNGGKTFSHFPQWYGVALSMASGSDGMIYLGITWNRLIRFNSSAIGAHDSVDMPFVSAARVFENTRISNSSGRTWSTFIANLAIATDTSPESPYNGRVYVVWAQSEERRYDAEYSYGYNFDVFSSYSDDKGITWSAPVRVNDDTGKGDQVFPSARVDSKGKLHVAFYDHRDNHDLPVFDVYYAGSLDGTAFSKNLRITNIPINNPNGGRSIGDYNDMVVAYPDKVYVAYPCDGSDLGAGSAGACVAEINTTKITYPSSNAFNYSAAFSQSGLPAGTRWSMAVNGAEYNTTDSSITVSGLSGTVSYSYAPPVSASAGTRYACTASCSGSISSPAEITASYKTQYRLTMSASPAGAGTVSPQTGSWHDAGSSVQISASPSSGYGFSSWTGSGTGSYTGVNNPATVRMNAPVSEAANFNNPIDYIAFSTSGLPDGTKWSVYVKYKAYTTTAPNSISVSGLSGSARYSYGYVIFDKGRLYLCKSGCSGAAAPPASVSASYMRLF